MSFSNRLNPYSAFLSLPKAIHNGYIVVVLAAFLKQKSYLVDICAGKNSKLVYVLLANKARPGLMQIQHAQGTLIRRT